MRSILRLLLVGALLAPVTAAAEGGCDLPSETSEVAVAASCGLEVVGAVEVSADGGLGQIAVHEDLGAVVQRDDGLVTLLDLQDPTAPTVLGHYDGGTGQERLDHPLDGDVVFTDDGTILLYARQTSDSSNEGLHVLDVTDPTNPVVTDIAMQGGMLRVAYQRLGETEIVVTQDAIAGLTIFELVRSDIGARALPLWVDPLPALKVGGPASAGLHIDPLDPVLGVPVLYATDGRTGLRLLDLSNPAAPVELGAWSDDGLAAIAVDVRDGRRLVHAAAEYWFDDHAYPELITLDATDPAGIVEVARRNLGEWDGELAWKLGGLHLDDRGLHIAHGHAGMVTLDPDTGAVLATTTDLGEPNPSDTHRFLAWFAMDVLRHGDHLLVSDAVTGEIRVLAPLA